MNNTYVLLSAGEGRRTKNYGTKSLFKFSNTTVLNYQIEAIRRFESDANIITVTGYESDKIRHSKPDCCLIVNKNYSKTNTGDSLKLAFNSIEGNLYIIHGDIIFSDTALHVPDTTKNCILIDTKESFRSNKIGVYHDNQDFVSFNFAFKTKWSQVAFISSDYLDDFYKTYKPNISIPEMITAFSDENSVLVHENKKSFLFEIETMKDLK